MLTAPQPEAVGLKRRVSVLLVDDHQENLLAMEVVLKGLGIDLVKALSGKEALKHLLTKDFAVILLDVQMPDMDGFETAALIRERERSRYTPIIFMTAVSKGEAHVYKGYMAGAVDYIFKPFAAEVLQAKVSVFVDLFIKTEQVREQAERLRRMENRRYHRDMAQVVAEVRRLNETLERRVAERTAQLETANKELESFSYSVSHDLKSPLLKIEGFSRLLIQRHSAQLDDEGKRLLGVIRASVQRMGQLIEDLLAFSRLGRKEILAADVDMASLARSVVEELRRLTPKRRVAATIHDLPPAQGDSALIRQVFFNLIANAFKFTRRKANPLVEIGSTPGEGDCVYWVKDNGAGFDMRYYDKLFGVFQRLHTAQEFEGTGIGLALVHRIVQRHGGKVWAEGAVDGGATFYFTLSRGSGGL